MTDAQPAKAEITSLEDHEESLHAELVEQRGFLAALHRALALDDAVNARPPDVEHDPAMALAEVDEQIAGLAASIARRREEAARPKPSHDSPIQLGTKPDQGR